MAARVAGLVAPAPADADCRKQLASHWACSRAHAEEQLNQPDDSGSRVAAMEWGPTRLAAGPGNEGEYTSHRRTSI